MGPEQPNLVACELAVHGDDTSFELIHVLRLSHHATIRARVGAHKAPNRSGGVPSFGDGWLDICSLFARSRAPLNTVSLWF